MSDAPSPTAATATNPAQDDPVAEDTTQTQPATSATEATADETEDSGAAESGPSVEVTAEEVVITIDDFTFAVPESIEPGAQITVRNGDSVGHTVTSEEEGVFDVAVGSGEEVTFTAPQEPGEYPFFCIPHPNMVSTLVVG